MQRRKRYASTNFGKNFRGHRTRCGQPFAAMDNAMCRCRQPVYLHFSASQPFGQRRPMAIRADLGEDGTRNLFLSVKQFQLQR